MPHGHPLSDDLRDVLVHMAHHINLESIVQVTGCTKRTVERLLRDFRLTGTAHRQSRLVVHSLRGRSGRLSGDDVKVSVLYFNCFI